MQLGFGSGVLVGTALTDASGNALANPTPIQFGVLQEASVDFSFDIKELFGQYQFPVAVGRGKGKITGKSKFAQLNGLTINSVFFGQTLTPARCRKSSTRSAPRFRRRRSRSPRRCPARAPGRSTSASSVPTAAAMTRVVSGPATGQYSVAAGVYTFAAADTAKVVRISYQYTATSTVAKKLTVNNVLMGQAPQFRADLYMPYNGKNFVLTLPANISSKLRRDQARRLHDPRVRLLGLRRCVEQRRLHRAERIMASRSKSRGGPWRSPPTCSQAVFGQSEPVPYRAPKKGLPLTA
jgi:hypothetical protein